MPARSTTAKKKKSGGSARRAPARPGPARTTAAGVLRYELELPLAAPRARVWEALTAETDAWWLPSFRMMGEGSRVRFEARAGGTLVEERPDGGSLLWYQVLMCVPGSALHLVGHLGPDFGGPATTLLTLTLVDAGRGCTLRVTDALHGAVGPDLVRSLESGWRQLFGDGLRRFVEGR